MKTAISVDDQLMAQADKTARKMGVSRSRLISIALGEYLRSQRRAEMTESLNRVYSDDPDLGERRMAHLYQSALGRVVDKW